jgi:hypothetical protein
VSTHRAARCRDRIRRRVMPLTAEVPYRTVYRLINAGILPEDVWAMPVGERKREIGKALTNYLTANSDIAISFP